MTRRETLFIVIQETAEPVTSMELPLFDQISAEHANGTSYHETFRRLYYHLYSNSDTSRAEAIFEDIAKLLLIGVLADDAEISSQVSCFMSGSGTAGELLLPVLRTRFPKLIGEEDGFRLSDNLVRLGIKELAGVNLAEAPTSVLGEAFQALIGPRLRGDRGQFFTPRELVRAMVAVARPAPRHKVVDPAAGTGGFLVEVQAYRTHRHPRHRNFGELIGLEKDRDLQRLGGAMVAAATHGCGQILLANSLAMNRLREELDPSPFGADIVLTNPPFGVRIAIIEKAILKQFALGHVWAFSPHDGRWHQQRVTRPSQDPQILFLDLCLHLLKPGGLLGIVLPEGVFGNRKTGYVWDHVRSLGTIEAMIDCPRTTFQPGTDTKTNVVFIRKFPCDKPTRGKILVAVAKYCGHDRRGRVVTANGQPVANDFKHIGAAYQESNRKWWLPCELSNPYYLIPRYYYGKAHSEVARLARRWNGQTVAFGELVNSRALVIRKGHEVGAEAYGTGDIPFVRTSDIHNWEISLNATNGVSDDVYQEFKNSQDLKPGDILLVVDGRYRIGRTAILHEHDCRCVAQSHFRIITTTKSSPVDCFGLLYILSRGEVVNEMRNLVFIQSTLGSIGKRLGELALPIPGRSHEWLDLVAKFRLALERRAQLLQELRESEGEEPEL